VLNFIEFEFGRDILERRNVYVELLQEGSQQYHFLIYEGLNFPAKEYLPVDFSVIKGEYVFFYDYRLTPLQPDDINFLLQEDAFSFRTDGKVQHLVLFLNKGKVTSVLNGVDEALAMRMDPKIRRKYKHLRR
jgi:hypothetical protein